MSDAPFDPEKFWNDAQFLRNEVSTFADTIIAMNPGNPWTALTCAEAEQLACIFSAAGRTDAYHHLIHQHALGDEAEEVDFHQDMLDGEAPPVPLGKDATEEAEALRQMVHGKDGGRSPDPQVSFTPCITGKVEVDGAVSEFMLPLDNDSVGFSQWGAPNEVLWSRVSLLDGLSGEAREWWAANKPEEDDDAQS